MHKSKSPKYSKLQSINLDTKNLQYTISLRENEIEVLKADIQNKKTYILNLEGEISNLRNGCLNNYKIEKELKLYKLKTDNLEKEIDKLNNDIINQQRKFDEEKRNIEKLHQSEILQLKLANDTYSQKIEIANQLMIDKKNLMKEVNSLKQEKDNIIFNNKETMREKEIKNKIKFSNLKKKMMDNINQTQSKVTELNIKYMDVSSKLTLLQNHQLLIQLEYQSQQIDELNEKKEELEKKIFELNKDIDIHKEVELNLAEKNKKLNSEILKLKKGKSENEKNENENKSIINNSISNNNNNNISLGFDENNFINTNYNKIKALEKKVLNLEKKLSQKIKDYNIIKDNFEYIETKLKNYERKYFGLFTFFEESLKLFCEDEEIKNNKEIYINIENLQKCDFTLFSKEEKYSILIILMKYLLPLINSSEIGTNLGNINLRLNYNKKYDDFENKKYTINSSRSSIDIRKNIKGNYFSDNLPSIRLFKNLNPSGMTFNNENK